MKKQEILEMESEILKELEEYNREKERVKDMLGKIGGKAYSKMDMIINILFLTIIISLFILEITTHFLPSFISLEVSVLLVSIKIVWMIHSQHKANHFQFWVLNSIEYRVNDLAKRIRNIEKTLVKADKKDPPN